VRQNINRIDKINFRYFICDFAIMGERYGKMQYGFSFIVSRIS
jgi:hypothetical protein